MSPVRETGRGSFFMFGKIVRSPRLKIRYCSEVGAVASLAGDLLESADQIQAGGV